MEVYRKWERRESISVNKSTLQESSSKKQIMHCSQKSFTLLQHFKAQGAENPAFPSSGSAEKMSRPFDQTQQSPPDFVLQQNTNTSHSPHGSIGALVGVLIVVLLLGLVAAAIGRVCSGRSILGYGHYDLGSWAEAKCASCIDGRINTQIPRPNVSATSSATANAAQTQQESELQPPQTADV